MNVIIEKCTGKILETKGGWRLINAREVKRFIPSFHYMPRILQYIFAEIKRQKTLLELRMLRPR